MKPRKHLSQMNTGNIRLLHCWWDKDYSYFERLTISLRHFSATQKGRWKTTITRLPSELAWVTRTLRDGAAPVSARCQPHRRACKTGGSRAALHPSRRCTWSAGGRRSEHAPCSWSPCSGPSHTQHSWSSAAPWCLEIRHSNGGFKWAHGSCVSLYQLWELHWHLSRYLSPYVALTSGLSWFQRRCSSLSRGSRLVTAVLKKPGSMMQTLIPK